MTQTQQTYFRPPSEADSLLIQVMQGCPHNQCTFCNIFKNVQFRVIPLDEVLRGLEADAREHGPELIPKVASIYLEGGAPVAMPQASLLRIMEHARTCFPAVERFACYATASSVIYKKPEELAALARAGLRRVYVGLESGVPEILKSTRKGCTREDLIKCGQMLREAGIENDVSMMLGIGGVELSARHALETADLLNIIQPVCVRIGTYVPYSGTRLADDCLRGRFSLLGPHATLMELQLLVEHIDCELQLLSNHWTNFIRFDAELPVGKEGLLEYINSALGLDERFYRPTRIIDGQQQ